MPLLFNMVRKKVFKTNSFSVILPSGWIVDAHQQPLVIQRELEDAGVIQISVFFAIKPLKEEKIRPELLLEGYLKKQKNAKIKINKYERKGQRFAVSDFYKSNDGSKDWFCKTMVVMNNNKQALMTYIVEYEFKNTKLKDVEEIFDSFMIE